MSRFVVCLLCLILTCCERPKKVNVATRSQLNLAFKYDPLTTDPRKNADPLSCALINMLYEGLLHEEPDGSFTLALAESYELEKNGTRITFHLRDANWSNGDPITSYDFEKSWKKILDPTFDSPTAYFLYPIKNAQKAKKGLVSVDEVGIKCPDSKTLIVKLKTPTPQFLQMLCFPTFFAVWEKGNNRATNEHPFGVFSGPFVLTEWHKNDTLTLQKNTKFWDEGNTQIKKVSIHIIPNELTSYRLFELGEIDWMGSYFSPIPQDTLKHAKKLPGVFNSQIAATTCCFYNIQCYPFNNLNIRKAFAYAIDREYVVAHFTDHDDIPAHGIVPPLYRKDKSLKFMPDGSKELALHYFELGLKELNLTKETFPKLTFDHFAYEDSKRLAQLFQDYWRETLDIEVNIQSHEVKIYLDKLSKKNFQFCLMSIISQYNDPYNIFDRFIDPAGPKNFCGWGNQKYKELLQIANSSLDEETRQKYFEKAESTLILDMPIAPIFHQSRTYLKNELLEDVQTCFTGRVDFRKAYFRSG